MWVIDPYGIRIPKNMNQLPNNLRPAEYQYSDHYRCSSATCGYEGEYDTQYDMQDCACPLCPKGVLQYTGESYPRNPDEWDEEKDSRGVWHRREHTL
jgi:hypothetical protein